jgi:hypothetical protein
MNAADLTEFQGKECVLLESGHGMVVAVTAFRDDPDRLFADLEITDATEFDENRIRMNEEPFIARWKVNFERVGQKLTISQPRAQVFRSAPAFLHFSSQFGGTRLFFLDEYVKKIRQQDGEGWEWETLMEKAGAVPRLRRSP